MATNPDRKSRPQVVLVNRALVLDTEEKILLIQRSKNDMNNPLKWELPGGKLDAGQDISNALEREVLEETGLVVIPIDKTAYWHSEILTKGRYKGLPYIVLVGITKSLGGNIRLSEEHDDHAWVSKEKIFDYDLVDSTRAALSVLIEKIFTDN
jgi:8-oxo-dGTP diphosphatase